MVIIEGSNNEKSFASEKPHQELPEFFRTILCEPGSGKIDAFELVIIINFVNYTGCHQVDLCLCKESEKCEAEEKKKFVG